ncbi:unnamed protein product [Ixodes pacificus]
MANASSHPDVLGLNAELVYEELWAQLAADTHQMEVNDSCSMLSPALIIRVRGLQLKGRYKLYLLFVPTDAMVRGSGGVWTPTYMPSKQALKVSIFAHPRGTMSGRAWMSKLIGFNNILLTSDSAAVQPKVYLELHRRYQPVFQFVQHDHPESLVFRQLRFVTVRVSSSSLQMELKARRLVNPASYMKEEHRKCTTHQRSVEEKPPLHGQQQEQFGRSLPGTISKPSVEKQPDAPECDSSGLSVSPLLVPLRNQKEASYDRRLLLTTTYQDSSGFALPSISSSVFTMSYSPPVQASSDLQDVSSAPRKEPAAPALPSLRDCYLPCNSEQTVEVSKTYQDFQPVPSDGKQDTPVPVNIRQVERERHEQYCSDLNADFSAQLAARRGTEQFNSPQEDDKFWSLLCEVCMDKPTDAVSAVAASKDTESEEFDYWVDALASNIYCNDTSPATTVGEKMIDILMSRFF